MLSRKNLLTLLSVFSLILAAHWYFFYLIAAKTGGQIVIGANNMSTMMGVNGVARQQAIEVMTQFQGYFARFSPLQFDWTIGPRHYVPVYLCAFFFLLALGLFVAGRMAERPLK